MRTIFQIIQHKFTYSLLVNDVVTDVGPGIQVVRFRDKRMELIGFRVRQVKSETYWS